MIPKSVNLSPSKRDIQVSYKNSLTLIISSANLRKHSPSAENKKKSIEIEDENDYENVLINKIEGVGNYAIRIHFSDGHSTGIFSWDYIYDLGVKLRDQSNP